MPKIISIHSCRHGTGKSNLTASLAVSLAQSGYRVGVIDLDVQLPGLHTIFGLDNEHLDRTLNHYLWDNTLTASANPFLTYGSGHVAIIGGEMFLPPCRIKINDIARLLQAGYDIDLLSRSVLELIKRLQLDYLLIDTHPTLGEETLFSIALSDILLLVSSLDGQDFQGLAVSVDIAHQLDVPKILLVANQVPSRLDAAEIWQQLEETYGEMVVGILPFTTKMLQLASSDVFCLRYPDHSFTQAIQKIAQQIVELETVLTVRDRSIEPEWLKPSASYPPDCTEKSGLNLVDILSLPTDQRHLVRWMMRTGTVALNEAVDYTRQSQSDTQLLLGTLIEQGFIQEITIDGRAHYQICLAARRGSKFFSSL